MSNTSLLNTSVTVARPLAVTKSGKVSNGIKHLLRALPEPFIQFLHNHLLTSVLGNYCYQVKPQQSAYHARISLNSELHKYVITLANGDLGFLSDRFTLSFSSIFAVCITPLFKRGSKLVNREDIVFLLAETFVFEGSTTSLTEHGSSLFKTAKLSLTSRPVFFDWVSSVVLLNFSQRSERFQSGFQDGNPDIFNTSSSSRIGSEMETTFCSTPSKIKRAQSIFPMVSAKKLRLDPAVAIPVINIELCSVDQLQDAERSATDVLVTEPVADNILVPSIEPKLAQCKCQTDFRILSKVRNVGIQVSFPEPLSFDESLDLISDASDDSLYCELPSSVRAE